MDKKSRPINFRVTCEMERHDLRLIHEAYKKSRTLRIVDPCLEISGKLNICNTHKIKDWLDGMPVTAYTLAQIRKRLGASDAGKRNAAMGEQ